MHNDKQNICVFNIQYPLNMNRENSYYQVLCYQDALMNDPLAPIKGKRISFQVLHFLQRIMPLIQPEVVALQTITRRL